MDGWKEKWKNGEIERLKEDQEVYFCSSGNDGRKEGWMYIRNGARGEDRRKKSRKEERKVQRTKGRRKAKKDVQ